MASNDFLLKNEIPKDFKNVIFLNFYKIFEVTFDMGLVEQIDNWLHLQAWFFMNFDRKILPAFLVMNELITLQKKPQKL